MIRTASSKQLTIAEFDWPFDTALDKYNRWVKLSACIPWDALAESYYQGFAADRGRPMKEARLVIGAVIIKHKLCLSDVETVQQIQENPYLQFFVGLPGYQTTEPFASSLFVEIRKRMGDAVFEGFHRAIIAAHEGQKPVTPEPPAPPATSTASQASVEPVLASSQARSSITSPEDTPPPAAPESSTSTTSTSTSTSTNTPTHQGQLIVDATVVEQAIRFPTDLSLLNEAREFSEKIIDALCKKMNADSKPRTYRQKARSAYLAVAKQKRPGAKVLRRGLKQQLQYLPATSDTSNGCWRRFRKVRPCHYRAGCCIATG
jgi:hypothetical protein